MVHLTEEQFKEHASRLMVIVNHTCGYDLQLISQDGRIKAKVF
jgi:hypothetical protein